MTVEEMAAEEKGIRQKGVEAEMNVIEEGIEEGGVVAECI